VLALLVVLSFGLTVESNLWGNILGLFQFRLQFGGLQVGFKEVPNSFLGKVHFSSNCPLNLINILLALFKIHLSALQTPQ